MVIHFSNTKSSLSSLKRVGLKTDLWLLLVTKAPGDIRLIYPSHNKGKLILILHFRVRHTAVNKQDPKPEMVLSII